MHSEALHVEICEPIATLRLNRPAVRNALNEVLITDLGTAIRAVSEQPHVRIIVLTAQGDTFCAGADLDWMARIGELDQAQNLADARALADMLHQFDQCPKPIIARVQGDAYGGGIGLISVCDIALADEKAQFALSEVKLGLVPATIAPYVLRTIGARQMRRYALSGEKFSAIEAQRLGLIHEVCSTENFEPRFEALINTLLQASPHAIASTKQLIGQLDNHALNANLRELTAVAIAQARNSEDGREGVAAFLEKRKPRWAK